MIKIYAIRDRALDAFNRPFFLTADGVAIRSFQDEINNKESEISKHADDYDLYTIGTYDENTGIISPHQPLQIAVGKQLIYRNGQGDQNA